jgi:SAM-dependent methyltransferase
MAVTDALRQLRWRLAGHYTRPLPPAFTAPLVGARMLEIGGPSGLFGDGGLLPVYGRASRFDNTQFADTSEWHDVTGRSDFAPDGTVIGEQHIVDGSTLAGIADDTYDGICNSHVIEHIANPLLALEAWRRVTRPGGHLLIVAPHMEGTFDHRRPLTTLDHIRADYAQGTTEDDLTHLPEVLELHDPKRDAPRPAGTWEGWVRDNPNTRQMHQHVFVTRSLLELLDAAGLQLLECETRFPHDIYVLARFPGADGAAPDNAAFLAASRPSPFPSDR